MFHITEIGASQTIIQSSLLYIKNYSSSERKSSSTKDLDEFPLLQYASRFWSENVQAIQDMAAPRTDDLIFEFLVCVENRSSWLRIHKPEQYYLEPFFPTDYEVASPLYYASLLCLCNIIERMIKIGTDMDAKGGYYGTALQAASKFRHSEVVKLLLKAGADVNIQGGYYGTALQAASGFGPAPVFRRSELVQLLLEAGADANIQGGYYGTALQAASAWGYSEVVKLLLEAGADVNIRGGYYGTALQAASAWGYSEAVKLLLEAGAEINTKEKVGEYGSALSAAVFGGKGNNLRILLDAGADVNALDDDGRKEMQRLLD